MSIPMFEAVKYNRRRERLERLEGTLEAVRKYVDSIVIPSVSDVTYLKKLLQGGKVKW